MTAPRRTRRRGFTLLEMVVVMWAMGVALMLGTGLILLTLKLGGVARDADTRAAQRHVLATEFRTDVARAEAAPDRHGAYSAGPTCVVLRMSDASAVVYRWAGERVERTELRGDKPATRIYTLDPAVKRVGFATADGVAALRWTEARGGRETVTEIAAAVGGDLR